MKTPNPLFSPSNMKQPRQPNAGYLSTSVRLQLNEATAPPANPRGTNPVPPIGKFFNDLAAASIGDLVKPTILPIDEEFQPATGVYILAAPNGSGKTVIALALAAWCNAGTIPCTYLSTFEPRCPVPTKGLFSNPEQYINDLKRVITPGTAPKMVICDSATLPLKANAAKFNNQATFTGGSQPSDRGFLDDATRLATSRVTCLIMVLNNTLVPYVQDLYGAVEGIININTVATFTISDRTSYSGRKTKQLDIPIDYVNAALFHLGYGTYNANARWTQRGYRGM
jgi:hypothetical protein